jgi:hypothetical protein
MIVPIRSPAATRRMLPSASSKTKIGRRLSMHSERRRVHDLEPLLDSLEVVSWG